MTAAAKRAANVHSFDNRDAASTAAAARLAGNLRAALEARERAALVVSGGTSPGPCLRTLAAADIDWSRVTVTPSDERWVPPVHEASNEQMIRAALLTGAAAAASWLPHYQPGVSIESGCRQLDLRLADLPVPTAATLLGMGGDGHFASLFPDFAGLRSALDPASTKRCVVVDTQASSQQRISLTLSMLLKSREILLLIFGDAKRRVLESALHSTQALPVTALLQQSATPVAIYWAP